MSYTKDELEEALREIWTTANDAEGSRSGMQDALDQIQELCVSVVPDVEETDDDEDLLEEDADDES